MGKKRESGGPGGSGATMIMTAVERAACTSESGSTWRRFYASCCSTRLYPILNSVFSRHPVVK